jgi:hypothetical protein
MSAMGGIFTRINRVYLDLSTFISELCQTKQSLDALLTRVSTVPPPVQNLSRSFWQENPPEL